MCQHKGNDNKIQGLVGHSPTPNRARRPSCSFGNSHRRRCFLPSQTRTLGAPLLLPQRQSIFLIRGASYSMKIQQILCHFRACAIWCAATGVTKIKLDRKLGKQGQAYEMVPLFSSLRTRSSADCHCFEQLCVEYKESNNNEITSSAEKVVRPQQDRPDRRLRPCDC